MCSGLRACYEQQLSSNKLEEDEFNWNEVDNKSPSPVNWIEKKTEPNRRSENW